MKRIGLLCLVVVCLVGQGCTGLARSSRSELSAVPLAEADWIRNGEPVEFEEELWYPTDELENLLSEEVFLIGEIRGVEVFIDRADVKPFERLYTRFRPNRYRAFEKRWQRP
jgi:hypothetical protein